MWDFTVGFQGPCFQTSLRSQQCLVWDSGLVHCDCAFRSASERELPVSVEIPHTVKPALKIHNCVSVHVHVHTGNTIHPFVKLKAKSFKNVEKRCTGSWTLYYREGKTLKKFTKRPRTAP